MKYTQEEIDRIISERVQINYIPAMLKRGMIAEWTFTYPTGMKTAEVAYAYPMNEEEHSEDDAVKIIEKRIEDKVWEICGKYTLATGDKL